MKSARKIAWPADKIERRSIDDVVPYERNARVHSPEQIEQIAKSIREFGFTMPILVAEDGTIIAGHGRLEAARSLGLDEVPVIVAKGWTDEQRRAYTIADNQLALNATWDDDMLRIELADLHAESFDLGLIGISGSELDRLLTIPEPAVAPEEFKAFDEDIATDHCCPKCGYTWSGKVA
jgi:ParB-like chromosome segregation protein Spo0J